MIQKNVLNLKTSICLFYVNNKILPICYQLHSSFLNPKVDTPEIIFFIFITPKLSLFTVLLYMYATWRITTQRCSKLNVTIWVFFKHMGNTNLKPKLTLQTLSPVSLMVIKIEDRL